VFAVILMAAAATPTLAAGSGEEIVRVLLYLPLFIIAARLGGDLAVRLRQPEVLGELLVGVLIGNLDLMGIHWADGVQTDPSLDLLAQLGVILLLFEVGLESTVREMSRVGPSSGLVAVLGVAAPFALGWWAGSLLLPDSEIYVHMFLGATLTATSVGITARVLQDLGKLRTDESRIILGAAVIDDVLGLVILSVVTGIIDGVSRGTGLSMAGVLWIVAKSLGFLGAAIGLAVRPAHLRSAGGARHDHGHVEESRAGGAVAYQGRLEDSGKGEGRGHLRVAREEHLRRSGRFLLHRRAPSARRLRLYDGL